MSFLSRDQGRQQARIRSMTCPRCQRPLTGRIEWRRTRIDVFCECGQMTSFSALALRYDFFVDSEAPGLTVQELRK